MDVKSFDCGNKDLNDFLCTDEVENYEKEQLGKTTLVYYNGELVAYYTISNDLLRMDYIKTYHGFSKLDEYRIEGIPAITIGRLAVDKKWQNKGIGRVIMQRISIHALNASKYAGIRLLLVQAKKDAFDFYSKIGFQFVLDTKRERKRYKARGTRTMFFDLKHLDYLRT
ncbi:MAG: GNAT family N-acetyltransferase [Thermoplasmata archaeon]|nr:MAG: GNAT family N-acetyltransferase [Thermoplasmata archaeon]